MTRQIRVSDEFHEYLESHSRENESMEETLRRLVGGPHPEVVAGILSSDTADEMRARLELRNDGDVDSGHEMRR